MIKLANILREILLISLNQPIFIPKANGIESLREKVF